MLKALFILEDTIRERVFPSHVYDSICQIVDVYAPPQSPDVVPDNPAILNDMDILISSWSCPQIDDTFLKHAPNLKVVFYGAGSIKRVVSEAFWERQIRITHSASANATTVAQFTLGQIILSLKGMWHYMRAFQQSPKFAGLYESSVGLIGLGMIGRFVRDLLQPFDIDVIVYDPYVTEEEAQQLNIQLVDLGTLFRTANVVSLHAPWLPETEGMITGEHIASMLPNSTFINTARGALVREDELITSLQDRPDLLAILDVTYPEPPIAGSLLYELPNVILTPHIAGAVDASDTRRLGVMMLDEIQQYLTDGTLTWEVTRDRITTMA